MRVVDKLINRSELRRRAGIKSQSTFESKLRKQVIGNHVVRFTQHEMNVFRDIYFELNENIFEIDTIDDLDRFYEDFKEFKGF